MVVVILISLLIIGMPIAFAILAAMSIFMSFGEFPYHIRLVASQMFNGMASFPLLAVPLFVLAGELMNESGITARIIAFANVIFGQMRAGLALVNIWASVIFAGISGSAVADASALGRVFIPEMEKHGYDRAYAAALTAAASVIGPIIPPSIPVIIYALSVSGVSVSAMFMAGIVPGILLAIFLSLYVRFTIKFDTNLAHEKLGKGKSNKQILIEGVIPLAMPVFIVGSILMGIVTPTEAASFAVAYAMFIGLFLYREIKLSDLPRILSQSMRDSSVLMIIIGTVSVANWVMAYNRIPNILTDWVLMNVNGQIAFLIAVNILLLFVGLFLEGIAAMLVLVPILHPIAVSLGINPIHFAIVVIFNLMIGLITPPFGLCLFVVEGIAGVGMARLLRYILPFFLVELVVLTIITFIPSTVLWIPKLLGL